MNPFDYVTAVTSSKKDLISDDPNADRNYEKVAFIVNRALSQHIETVLYANEMNIDHHLDGTLQFQFLINSIRKKKLFGKWPKAVKSEELEIIKECYGYSYEKARDVLGLLTNDQLLELKKKVYKGGTRKP